MLGSQDRECHRSASKIASWQSQVGPTRHLDGEDTEGAEVAFDLFVASYGLKYGKAVDKLTKDNDALFAFYDFPAEHWTHIRTTNPVESVFATVRNRTQKTRGCLSRKTALVMVYKLMMSAKKNWCRLSGSQRLAEVIGVYSDFFGLISLFAKLRLFPMFFSVFASSTTFV